MLKPRFVPLAVLGAITLSLVSSSPAVLAGPPTPFKKAAPAAAASYECQECHMRFSAATAKKDKFIDPMDGGKLVLVKATPKTTPVAKPTPHKK